MGIDAQIGALEEAIAGLSKDDIVRLLLDKLATKEDVVPISIFSTGLSPLEAISRFLKENDLKISEIARILNKSPSSISLAYKNASSKSFIFTKSHISIPLSEFSRYPTFSILETAVSHLKSKGFRFTEIADLLDRDPRTVWTIHSRAKAKMKDALSSSGKIASISEVSEVFPRGVIPK